MAALAADDPRIYQLLREQAVRRADPHEEAVPHHPVVVANPALHDCVLLTYHHYGLGTPFCPTSEQFLISSHVRTIVEPSAHDTPGEPCSHVRVSL